MAVLRSFFSGLFLAAVVVGLTLLAFFSQSSPGFFLLAFGALLWLCLYRSRRHRRRFLRLRLSDLDRLSGADFERWIQVLLDEAGFSIEDRAIAEDFGVDVLATYRGVRIGIQAKRYERNVGNAAVQEVHAGADYHSCDLAAVVTQSGYTKAARAQAERLPRPCVLIGRDELPGMVEILQSEARATRV